VAACSARRVERLSKCCSVRRRFVEQRPAVENENRVHFNGGELRPVLRSCPLLQHSPQAWRLRVRSHKPQQRRMFGRAFRPHDPELHHARVEKLLQKRMVSHTPCGRAQPFRARLAIRNEHDSAQRSWMTQDSRLALSMAGYSSCSSARLRSPVRSQQDNWDSNEPTPARAPTRRAPGTDCYCLLLRGAS